MSESQTIVIATRGSQLALWQAQHVANLLIQKGIKTELKIYKTTGDKIQDRPLHEIGGKGLFVRELETALLKKECDIAVHSLKDLPVKTPDELVLEAFLPRDDPRDAFILKYPLTDAPPVIGEDFFKAHNRLRIATGSLRRSCLIKALKTDIHMEPLRGNVDTRLAKLQNSDWDGIILAKASLDRLGLFNPKTCLILDSEWFVPSPSQGVLVIETRLAHPLRHVIKTLECSTTANAVRAERELLRRLGGDCTMPCGIHVRETTTGWSGAAVVIDNQGREARAVVSQGNDPKNLAGALFEDLVRNGLEQVMDNLGLKIP